MVSKTIATERYIGIDVPDEIAMPLARAKLMKRIHYADSGCWEYTGYCLPTGYGSIIFKKRNWRVHRLMYTIEVGPIPDGMVIMHQCDNIVCINPAHLKADTQRANLADMLEKGRHRAEAITHCPRGHSYAEHGNLTARGTRNCKRCDLVKGRIRAGWPEHLWELPPQKLGSRPHLPHPSLKCSENLKTSESK